MDQTLRPGGCLEVVRRWQKEGLIGSVGFSTHGPSELIVHYDESKLSFNKEYLSQLWALNENNIHINLTKSNQYFKIS